MRDTVLTKASSRTREPANDPFESVAVSPVAENTAVVWNRDTSFTIQPVAKSGEFGR
jgi:hypothetical protein